VTKRDTAIAVTSAVVAGAVCYALAVTRPIRPPTPSRPLTASEKVASNDHVIMRVNGEPVTESEFLAFYRQLPPEMQQQYASEIGKETVGEQLIRMKLLEQEAHRLGVDRDPKVVAQLKADTANILAGAAAEKLIAQPNEQAIREFYAKNRSRFETVDLSHILIAYTGGSLPARGGSSPALESAKKKASAVYDQLKAGAIQLVIYTATGALSFSDEKAIRRSAVLFRVPCITTLSGARAAVEAMAARQRDPIRVWSLQQIHEAKRTAV